MFNSNGSWKEFGVGRGDDHTVLPFWFFAIFWAFISYGVALVIMSQFASMSMASPESNHMAFQQQQPTQSIQLPSVQQVAPVANHGMMPSLTIGQPGPAAPASAPASTPAPSAPPGQGPAPEFMRPVSSMMGIPNGAPGYYVLQNQGLQGPQYVYYGTSPPPAPRA